MRTAVVVVAAALAGLALAPAAHADRTITATQACDEIRPGSWTIQLGMTELSCQDPEVWQQHGTLPGTPSLAAEMAVVFPGSYRVQPANRWSDWVIPD